MKRKHKCEISTPTTEATELPADPPAIQTFDVNRVSELSPSMIADYLNDLADGAVYVRCHRGKVTCYSPFAAAKDDEVGETPVHDIVNDGKQLIELQLFDALLKVRDKVTLIAHAVSKRAYAVIWAQLPATPTDGRLPMLRAGVFKEGKLERTVLFADPREEFCRAINETCSGQVARLLQSEVMAESVVRQR